MLKINEIFPAVQGEGKSQGKQVVFLRTALCNLHCIWCDTPYTWNFKGTKFAHPDKYDREQEVHEMTTEQVVQQIKDFKIKAVVVSGGEPFLQQRGLVPVVEQLRSEGFWIEVETNGTIVPNINFVQSLDQINCSPKLSNSLDEEYLRIRPAALKGLVATGKANFKFVITCHQDVVEAVALMRTYNMKEVYFMPQGRTKAEIEKVMHSVRRLADICKVNFTTRQHILDFGNKRGV